MTPLALKCSFLHLYTQWMDWPNGQNPDKPGLPCQIKTLAIPQQVGTLKAQARESLEIPSNPNN
jgi:hypothetical protein